MKTSLIAMMTIFMFFVIPFCSTAAEVEGVTIIEYGIFKAKELRQENTPATATGTSNIVTDVELVQRTDNIPAIAGTRFGFRCIIKGSPQGQEVKIVRRNILPGLRNPKTGNIFYTEEYERTQRIGKEFYIGYKFEENWELIPGKWTFQLFYGGRKLAEKTFNVYKP